MNTTQQDIRSAKGSDAAKHTPGPWNISAVWQKPLDTHGLRLESGHLSLAEIYNDIPEGNANARLIASAPDLLAALKCVVAALSQPVQRTDLTDADRSRLGGVVQILRGDAIFAVNAAQSAIAKAEGRS